MVADGANSRFGRALGTSRDRTYPMGMAIRGYYTSPYHDEPWIESHLDLRDRDGNHMPGYGWIFPVGDGTVNVGAGLLDTFTGFNAVNTTKLIDAFVAMAPARWGITPQTSCGPPTGGRLPTGGSVLPKVGPTWIVAGDAAGSINPFNGEGIAYAYETGRMVAETVSEALRTGDGLALARYPDRLEETYGLYFKVARTFVKIIGNPGHDARAHASRDAFPAAHGVGAADHGQSAPSGRDRSGGGGVRGRRAHRPRAPRADGSGFGLERTTDRSDSWVMAAMNVAEVLPDVGRLIMLNENLGGHATMHLNIYRALAEHPELDFVALDVPPRSIVRRVAGLRLPGLSRLDVDLAPVRAQLALSTTAHRMLRAAIAAGPVGAIHAYSQHVALRSVEELAAYPSVVSTDGSAAQNAVQLPFRQPGRFTPMTARVGEHFEAQGVRRGDHRGRAVGVVCPGDP